MVSVPSTSTSDLLGPDGSPPVNMQAYANAASDPLTLVSTVVSGPTAVNLISSDPLKTIANISSDT